MKKYSVQLQAFASASYYVEAETEEEAIEKAYEKADMSDLQYIDWDYQTKPDVIEVKE